MELATTLLKKQIRLLRPIANSCPVGITRAAQDKMGELMLRPYDADVTEKDIDFGDFMSTLITPNDRKSAGIVLYLHGGGYVTGGLKYCKGFGTVLAAKTGAPVLCVAYRIAPEHPFPAALDDALRAYNYILSLGYDPKDIAFCGESAGGGLCFSLAVKLRELGKSQPGGIVAISPWTDLTLSGASHTSNADRDPSLTTARLREQADMYSADCTDPHVSPLFADLSGLAPSKIYVGSDEILLDDSVNMYNRLIQSGDVSSLVIREDMWHAYMLFGVKEAEADLNDACGFISEVTSGIPQT